MKKHLFITSIFGLMAAPGVAAVDIASDAVDASCNSSVLHSTSGSVELEADWALNNYDCGAGKYFDTTTATCLTCTADNYCPGGTFTVESLTNGLNNCPTTYPLSAAGAGAQTDCYRQCTTSDVAHSTAVSGGYYYENNNQCVAESCAVGWNASPIPLDATPTNSSFVYLDKDGIERKVSANINYPASYYGLTQPGTWGVDLGGDGAIRGSVRLSAKTGDPYYSQNDIANWTATTAELDAAGDGTNCWCRIDDYRAKGGEWENYAANWVLLLRESRVADPVTFCTNSCANLAQSAGNYDSFALNRAIQSKVCNIINRDCGAGYYFDSATATCVTCTANSYCPGGTYNMESESYGINACPTGYGLSVAGMGAQTKCYRTCTTSDVAHSTAVRGGYYYGNNNQCSATSCAAGWHVGGGADLSDNLPSNAAVNSAAITASGNFLQRAFSGPARDMTYYGWTSSDTNHWGANFTDWGTVKGVAKCSAKGGNSHIYTPDPSRPWESVAQWGGDSADWSATDAELDAAGDGTQCWCQVDGYRADGSDEWESVDAPTWVFQMGDSSCTGNCAWLCADGAVRSSYFRTALFTGVRVGPFTCEANIIDLDWNPLNGGEHTQNQCTYNESITLPTEPTKQGYTFGGWSVVSGN